MSGGGPPQARDVLEDQYEVGEGTCRGLEKPAFACLVLESVAQEAMLCELGASNEDGIVCVFNIREGGAGGESPWSEMIKERKSGMDVAHKHR